LNTKLRVKVMKTEVAAGFYRTDALPVSQLAVTDHQRS